MLDIILELLGMYLFSYPGGVIRWIIFRKKTLNEYVKDDPMLNFGAFSLLVGIILVIINYI